MKTDFKDLTILILAFICIVFFGMTIESRYETSVVTMEYEHELYKTREQLNVVKDELGKAKHHIWLLNKEREAE